MGKYEELLWKTGLMPELGRLDMEKLDLAARALAHAGIRVFDLPVTAEHFAERAAVVKKDDSRVLAASGVRNLEDCEKALESGAELLLSYSLRQDVADWCKEKGLAYIPGCATAAEIEQALDRGLNTVLYTPCFSPEPCKELYGIWKERGLRFLVSGGISRENYLDYADKPYILAVRGSFLCPEGPDCESEERAAALAEKLYLKNLGFELGHVGISTESDEAGHALADEISEVFGMKAEHGHVGNWSLLRGIEIVNGKGPGLHGHIAVQCNNVERAIYYLENHGHKVKRDSFRFRYPGRLSFAYLEEEFGGFAIHLMLRWTAP